MKNGKKEEYDMGWVDYVLFYKWLTDAEVNDTLCIQTRNDGKFIIKLIKHEKEGTPLRGHGIQYDTKE